MPINNISVIHAWGDSGFSGYSGYSGISGFSGFSGYSGVSGFSGFSGYSGISGFSGRSGFGIGSGDYSGLSGQVDYISDNYLPLAGGDMSGDIEAGQSIFSSSGIYTQYFGLYNLFNNNVLNIEEAGTDGDVTIRYQLPALTLRVLHRFNDLTEDRNYTWPNRNGTIALNDEVINNSGRIDTLDSEVSHISGNYLPLTGGDMSGDVYLQGNSLFGVERFELSDNLTHACSFRVENEQGDIAFNYQFPDATRIIDHDYTNLTEDRTYTWPNRNGTIALKDHEVLFVSGDASFDANTNTILADASSSNITIGLPSGFSGITPRTIKKIDDSNNSVIVSGVDSQTVDGDSTAILIGQYDSITCVYRDNWYIV